MLDPQTLVLAAMVKAEINLNSILPLAEEGVNLFEPEREMSSRQGFTKSMSCENGLEVGWRGPCPTAPHSPRPGSLGPSIGTLVWAYAAAPGFRYATRLTSRLSSTK